MEQHAAGLLAECQTSSAKGGQESIQAVP
eukprot:SAG22_NODE_11510_length_481_cov_0.913613_1_plen_28_part_10